MKVLLIVLFCVLVLGAFSMCTQSQKLHAEKECSTCHDPVTLDVIKEKHPTILKEEYRGGHKFLCRDCHTRADCSKCHVAPEEIPLKE